MIICSIFTLFKVVINMWWVIWSTIIKSCDRLGQSGRKIATHYSYKKMHLLENCQNTPFFFFKRILFWYRKYLRLNLKHHKTYKILDYLFVKNFNFCVLFWQKKFTKRFPALTGTLEITVFKVDTRMEFFQYINFLFFKIWKETFLMKSYCL